MAVKLSKERSIRFYDIRDPKKTIGLWSCHAEYRTRLFPVANTRQIVEKFYPSDLLRHETQAEAFQMMAAKGWTKSTARKMKEYAAQYLGETYDEENRGSWLDVPRWFMAWSSFSKWLQYAKEAVLDKDVRLSFCSPVAGEYIGDDKHRTGRVMFLRRAGRTYVAVMMKSGWYGWPIIEKSAYQDDPYERLILSSGAGLVWQTVDADIIEELVHERGLCLFEMEHDAIFDALTSSENAREQMGKMARRILFYLHDADGPHEEFYMSWTATYNPLKSKCVAFDRNDVRLIEVMRERKKPWIEHQIGVERVEDLPDAARWVVEHNGCMVLPANVSDELRVAAVNALFYITFPDRAIDAPGGLLRGYQLTGRLVQAATKRIRYEKSDHLVEKAKQQAKDVAERRRALVVTTLLDRAARVLAERNGLDKTEALARIEQANGRAIIETAAWRWGFMDGNALTLFTPTPQAGSLKLPDLSLAISFEHRLGLEGAHATVGRLVQTARIRPLAEAHGTVRVCKDVQLVGRRCWTPKRGTEKDILAYSGESVRIILDEGHYYLMAIPKFAQYRYERDLAYEPGSNAVAVKAYRSVSGVSGRSRHDNYIEEETFDYGKLRNLAQTGRLLLYSIEPGPARGLFEATYSVSNARPSRIVPMIPQMFAMGSTQTSCRMKGKNGVYLFTDVPAEADEIDLRFSFVINPNVKNEGRKAEGRSWKSYCDAHPDDAQRPTIAWPPAPVPHGRVGTPLPTEDAPHGRVGAPSPTGEAPHGRVGTPLPTEDAPHGRVGAPSPTEETLKGAVRRVVESDGVLLTDEDHLEQVLEAMKYVVMPGIEPTAPGGVYDGYVLSDRVFKTTDGRSEWRKAQQMAAATSKDVPHGRVGAPSPTAASDAKRKEAAGKPLVEVLSPAIARTAEAAFSAQVEADPLTDKKTAKFFTLEAPIVIGDAYREMVAREFRRVVYTGTMGWRKQIIRPAHEVALGIWLARLVPEPPPAEPRLRPKSAPVSAPSPEPAQPPDPEQEARLATLEALLAEGLVTQEEYVAKRIQILGIKN